MAAVSLLRLAESLLLKTVSTYLSFWVFITQTINYYITFIALGCNQTIRAYYLACCSNARELCILIAYNLGLKAKLPLPCERRLHFRGMSWRAKSSLCRQPFNFLSCMRKIRHAIRKQLVRQICVSFAGKLPANYSPRASVLFFCFAPSGFNYFSRKISTDHLF